MALLLPYTEHDLNVREEEGQLTIIVRGVGAYFVQKSGISHTHYPLCTLTRINPPFLTPCIKSPKYSAADRTENCPNTTLQGPPIGAEWGHLHLMVF